MTGNIRMKNSFTGAYKIRMNNEVHMGNALNGNGTCNRIKENTATAICTAILAFRKAAELKKEVSSIVVELSEALADKMAREGLFGEDRGMGYCGTDVEYIPENAIELRYLNFDFTGFDNGQVKNYVKQAKTAKYCEKSVKNESVLRVFNGF